MLFNSLDFAIFLPIVFILYWFVFNKKIAYQNSFVLAASYFFYAWWDWRFLFLILFSTIVDFLVGKQLNKTSNSKNRKLLLWVSVLVNLGLLGFFKYYNFFVENFVNAFSFFGQELNASFLHIILPVGISFYTFQTLSYTIDIYRRELRPTLSFINFAAFVSFFPQLVAGPIERAKDLLPQFYKKRKFDLEMSKDGLRQILWGLFKKMVVADNCAVFVDRYFENYQDYSGSTLLVGAFFFTIQIYCDFSGYSDIAIGTSRLFGFKLIKNFDYPYFARNIAEFWKKWHISLTTWFKDYVYFPMGGSRLGKFRTLFNTVILFLIIGLWHGAHWKFVVYGFINSLHFFPIILFGQKRKFSKRIAENKFFPSLRESYGVLKTFTFLVLVRVFFRAESLEKGLGYLNTIFSSSFFSFPSFENNRTVLITLVFILFFLMVEWLGRNHNYALEKLGLTWKRPYRWAFYYTIIFCIFFFYGAQQQFIYFQF
jgi:D-alanyl-lipoteichoic acid acyltransferase DltB (MBOAT superfamily)